MCLFTGKIINIFPHSSHITMLCNHISNLIITPQVHLVKSSGKAQDSSSPQTADYVNYPSNQMDVHLYDVNNVLVDIEAELEHLTTDWEETKLHIDGATKNIKSEDHPLSIAGFKQSNIFFRTDDNKDAFKQVKCFNLQTLR